MRHAPYARSHLTSRYCNALPLLPSPRPQVAKALVVSLPFVPDGVAILHACKALAEERQAGNAEAGQAGQAQQQGGQQQTQQQQQQMGLWG